MSYLLPPTPHCTLSHSSSLLVANITGAYAIPFSTHDDISGMTHTIGDSKIYVTERGIYLVAVSALVDISSAPAGTFDLWVKVNGTDLANSNTSIGIPNTSNVQTLAVTFLLDMTSGGYFELYYCGSTTNVRIPATAAGANPTRPAVPSIIVTVNKVGR
jgi:hypothetical protein